MTSFFLILSLMAAPAPAEPVRLDFRFDVESVLVAALGPTAGHGGIFGRALRWQRGEVTICFHTLSTRTGIHSRVRIVHDPSYDCWASW